MAGVPFLGCEDTTTEPDPTVQYDVVITQPTSLAKVTGQLIVRATAVGAEEAEKFPLADNEGYSVEGLNLIETLAQPRNGDGLYYFLSPQQV